MQHQLASGLLVNDKQYYQLLDWKDKNLQKCLFFLQEYGYTSINQITNLQTFKSLLAFANID